MTVRDPVGNVRMVEVGRDEIEAAVREVLEARAKLPVELASLDADSSLYDAGMTSHATVKVMLGIEDRFEVEFPDELLERAVFDRISTIADALEKLLAAD